MMQNVRQQQGKSLLADDVAGAPDGMAEPQRGLLAGEARLSRPGEFSAQRRQLGDLATLLERPFQFVLAVEVIFDGALVAAGNENKMLDAGAACLVDDVLNERPVDDGQHLLRHGLAGWQEPGSKPGHREYGLTDRLWRFVHAWISNCGQNMSACTGQPL